ncbi:serine protease snake-like isoform X2 [Copidosoma floridanum]|uniref:serine protease snake-like isoform X2 n=1 Tax=Copidosoma floridanum TaxID=29053 RepID=UPI0006C97602|nr:serine protease snake-like isoform X2 [Copidosoma floridanum]
MLSSLNYRLMLLFCATECFLVAGQVIGSECSLKNQQGTCQLLTKCTSVYNELIAGKRPESVCGYKDRMPIICCPNSGSTITRSTTQSTPAWGGNEDLTTNKPFKWNHRIRRAQQMCQEYAKSVYALVEPPVLTGGDRMYVNVSLCAIKSKKLIVGGTKAEPKEFPHMAAIGYTKNNKIYWNCGGSLISDLWVLTAAHCTYSFQWGYAEHIRVGDLNLESKKDDARPQDRRVIERVRHPDYKKPAQYNDIALLKMDRPVTFDAYVRPACLSLNPNIQTGEKTVVAGWGIVDWFDEKGSPDLLKVTLPIVAFDTCKGLFANEGNKLPKGLSAESQLCAGEDGKDTCQGDSGGPLMVYSNSEECMYDIVGVTSFGKLCGSVIPGVYSKVYHYLDWIENTVWP